MLRYVHVLSCLAIFLSPQSFLDFFNLTVLTVSFLAIYNLRGSFLMNQFLVKKMRTKVQLKELVAVTPCNQKKNQFGTFLATPSLLLFRTLFIINPMFIKNSVVHILLMISESYIFVYIRFLSLKASLYTNGHRKCLIAKKMTLKSSNI